MTIFQKYFPFWNKQRLQWLLSAFLPSLHSSQSPGSGKETFLSARCLFPLAFEFLKEEYCFILFQICSAFPDSHLTFSSSLFLMTIFFLPHCFSFLSSSPASAALVSPSGSVLLIALLPSATTALSPSPTFPTLVSPLLSTHSFPVLFPPRFSKGSPARASSPFLPAANWAVHEFPLLVAALQLSSSPFDEMGTAPDKSQPENYPGGWKSLGFHLIFSFNFVLFYHLLFKISLPFSLFLRQASWTLIYS